MYQCDSVGGEDYQLGLGMNWLQKITYNTETAWLRNWLRSGIDEWDYPHLVSYFLDEKGVDVQFTPGESDYDIGLDWLERATEEDRAAFREWLKDYGYQKDEREVIDQPAYMTMGYSEYVKPTWLVHFTDDAASIERNGFEYGHEEFEGLHLTTWYGENTRRRNPGYNFAFRVFTTEAVSAADTQKYGKEAVIFWGSGVEVEHYGDMERQIIIWGPSVNKRLIFPITKEYDEWVAQEYDQVFKKGDFEDVVNWVVNHYELWNHVRNARHGRKEY